jgi:hypothetical protein
MNAGEQKQNSATTTEEEMENHQKRNNTNKLSVCLSINVEKIRSTNRTDKILRLHKLWSIFNRKEIMKTNNEGMTEILAGKDLNMWLSQTTSFTQHQQLLQKK